MWCSVVLRCVALRCVALCYVVLRCVALCYIVLCCVALCCVVLRCIALHCVVLHCAALHCAALYCVALCYIVLCCIVLHCVALRCATLSCVALCYIVLRCVALRYVVWETSYHLRSFPCVLAYAALHHTDVVLFYILHFTVFCILYSINSIISSNIQIGIHARAFEDLSVAVEALEKENLEIMQELFDCKVEDLNLAR